MALATIPTNVDYVSTDFPGIYDSFGKPPVPQQKYQFNVREPFLTDGKYEEGSIVGIVDSVRLFPNKNIITLTDGTRIYFPEIEDSAQQ